MAKKKPKPDKRTYRDGYRDGQARGIAQGLSAAEDGAFRTLIAILKVTGTVNVPDGYIEAVDLRVDHIVSWRDPANGCTVYAIRYRPRPPLHGLRDPLQAKIRERLHGLRDPL